MTDLEKMSIDLICQHTREGNIIPLRIRVQDEDMEYQELNIKRYREKNEIGLIKFECDVVVRDTKKTVTIFSSDGLTWKIKY